MGTKREVVTISYELLGDILRHIKKTSLLEVDDVRVNYKTRSIDMMVREVGSEHAELAYIPTVSLTAEDLLKIPTISE